MQASLTQVWRSEDSFQELGLHFYHGGSRDWLLALTTNADSKRLTKWAISTAYIYLNIFYVNIVCIPLHQ